MAKVLILAQIFFLFGSGFAEDPLTPKEIQLTTQPEKKALRKSPTVKAAFSPFTGKVIGEKVRMRLQPDLEGYIVSEINKNELISIVDQEGDYYCVTPPNPIKAFIFRSFVLDGVVEGNRVNVRLEPDLESPVIGHLNSGDRIEGQVSAQNRKWLEIEPPEDARFYVSKEFIEYAGGPELKEEVAKRKSSAEQQLESAKHFAHSEMQKLFEEIDFEKVKQGFTAILHDFTDFPKKAEEAKEALTALQEEYLEKRIAYLEKKAALATSTMPQEPLIARASLPTTLSKTWSSIEEGLYASWANTHDQRNKEEFYQEQKLIATTISGVLEAFQSPVKNKPGDFVVKNKNLPTAYVYSTMLDLQEYVGKQVTLVALPRDNNHFAFPAYFVYEIE